MRFEGQGGSECVWIRQLSKLVMVVSDEDYVFRDVSD